MDFFLFFFFSSFHSNRLFRCLRLCSDVDQSSSLSALAPSVAAAVQRVSSIIAIPSATPAPTEKSAPEVVAPTADPVKTVEPEEVKVADQPASASDSGAPSNGQQTTDPATVPGPAGPPIAGPRM
jgi:hypothetical protein